MNYFHFHDSLLMGSIYFTVVIEVLMVVGF